MTADECYGILLYICNKFQGGQPSPEEYKRVMKFAQAGYQSFLLGNFEQYQYGRPIARVTLGQNQHVYESLSPFFVDTTLTITNARVIKPTDYEATVSMRTASGNQNIRFAQMDSWNGWVNSVIDPIANNPIHTLDSNGFKFAPATLATANLTYVQTPPETIWNFTLDTDGLPVYNPTGSVGLLWHTHDMMEVISRALRIIGVNLQAGAVMQFSNEITAKGQ